MANIDVLELEAHFRNIVDTIWLISLEEGTVEILRDSMTPMLEGEVLDYASLCQTYVREFVYPADLALWNEILSLPALRSMCQAGCQNKRFDMRFRNQLFGFEWHEAHISVLPAREGAQARALLTSQNVNEKRKAAIVAKAVETEYDYVVYIESTKNSYVMYDSNCESGTPLPPVASDDYQLEVSEFHRKHVPQEERDSLTWRLSIAHVRPILQRHGEYVTYCKVMEHGVAKEKKLRFSYFDKEKDIWLLTRTDITEVREEKRQKRQLQYALNTAKVANRAKSEFLSRMSHDIRTPMNAIMGMTTIAHAHMDDQERVADCLSKITLSSRLLLSLINEVLDMSKVESGKIVLAEEEIQLPDLVQSVVTMIQPVIAKKALHFDIHIENLHNESIVSDMQRLQQVLMNILSNAAKYTQEGGHILLEIWEKPASQPGMACYEFSVADDGIGMKPDFLEKVFEPFERADDEAIRYIQGTGLGMAISKSIVEMMGGAIWAESVYGKGSRFTARCCFRLGKQASPDPGMLKGRRILVADDDEAVCRSICQKLEELGIEGQWTQKGGDAVQKAVDAHMGGNDYFALILDLNMPGMNGIEAARQIRAKAGIQVPIILISAYDWFEFEEEAMEAGITCFMVKPLFQSRLACKLKQFLEESPTQKPMPPLGLKPDSCMGKRILLVEDNQLNREIGVELISSTGAQVETAENGKIALDRMQEVAEGYYDLIFMDVQMPLMDGCAATAAIRSLERDDVKKIPIIAMTANAFMEDVEKAKKAGMDEHLAKPIDMARLAMTLDRWFRDGP